jgi:hypothetical protein
MGTYLAIRSQRLSRKENSMLSMAAALKGFEKNGKVSKLTDNGAYKVTLHRQLDREDQGQFLIEVYKVPRKGEKAPEKPELNLRYDNLTKALSIANQALRGGLDSLIFFNRLPQDR